MVTLLGDPDVVKQIEDGETNWKWIKGTDQSGQELFFSVETCGEDTEYIYNYTEDDATEIFDWAEMDEILEYVQRFGEYVQQTHKS